MSKMYWKRLNGPGKNFKPYADFVLYRNGKRTGWRLVPHEMPNMIMGMIIFRNGVQVAGPYEEACDARIEAERLAKAEGL